MREIRLDDREQVEKLRRIWNHELSSHAFPSIYLWKEKLGLQIDLQEDGFLVRMGQGGAHTYYFPCGSPEAVRRFIRAHEAEPDFTLTYLREADKSFLEEHFPGRYEIEEVPDSEEYIYDREGLSGLQGSAYANVRKRMNRLHRSYQVTAAPFEEKDEPEVQALLERHVIRTHEAGQFGLVDDDLPEQAFAGRKELGLYGVVIRVDGEVRGVAFGFPINEDTIDGCMECHDPEIEGLSCYTQMAMLLEAPEQYRYMNGEEDLGIPGLRSMKRYMNPCRMNQIYTAKQRTV